MPTSRWFGMTDPSDRVKRVLGCAALLVVVVALGPWVGKAVAVNLVMKDVAAIRVGARSEPTRLVGRLATRPVMAERWWVRPYLDGTLDLAELSGTDSSRRLAVGQWLMESGRTAESLAVWNQDEQIAQYWLDRAIVLRAEGDIAGARSILTEIVAQIVPTEAGRLYSRGLAAFWGGDYERAAEDLGAVVALEPTPETRVLLGRILLQTGEYERAVTVLQEVLATEPADFEALVYISEGYQGLGDLGGAWDACDRAIESVPRSPTGWLRCGQVALASQMCPQALTYLQEASRLDPDHWATRYLLAQTYDCAGDSAAALQSYQSILEYPCESAPVLLEIGRFALAQGAPAVARQAIQMAEQLAPDSVEVLEFVSEIQE